MKSHQPKLNSASMLACAVVALSSIGFAGVAAASSTAPSAEIERSVEVSERSEAKKQYRHGESKRGRYQRMSNAALLVPGYGPVPQEVVDSLSLNAEQVALLDEAKAFISEHRNTRREQLRSKTRRDADASAPLNPRAALERQEERFQAMRALRAEGTQKWLAVWDSLDSGQQQIVSDYVVKRGQERAVRAAEYREKREARRTNKD